MSVFLSDINVTGSKILAAGMIDYSVFNKNCVLDGSEFVIDSARSVNIMYSHFIMKDVIRIYNTGSLFMTDTHFKNQAIEHDQNERGYSKIIKFTNLVMKMENVFIAELKDCSFKSIRSEMNNGSAIFLKNTGVLRWS